MKINFKVGDRVRVTKLVECDKHSNLKIGDEGIIKTKSYIDSNLCSVDFGKNFKHKSYNWNDKTNSYDMFTYQLELVEDKKETIVIYRNGKEVTALDKSTGKKAVAKCSPQDKFDFYTGAKLALDRLVEKHNITFRLLCVKNNPPFCKKGKIYEFVNGVTTWDDTCESSEYSNYNDFVRHNVVFSEHFVKLKEGDNPEEILKKWNTINKGCKVKVINNGGTYTTYNAWVERNIESAEHRYMWDFNKTPCNGDIGYVIKIAPWKNDDKDMLAYVEIKGRCYIMCVEALEKC